MACGGAVLACLLEVLLQDLEGVALKAEVVEPVLRIARLRVR